MHAITANKGPVVHAYQELTQLAQRQGRKFYFESAVMDGAPIFSLFRESLPAADLRGFQWNPEFHHQPDPHPHGRAAKVSSKPSPMRSPSASLRPTHPVISMDGMQP